MMCAKCTGNFRKVSTCEICEKRFCRTCYPPHVDGCTAGENRPAKRRKVEKESPFAVPQPMRFWLVVVHTSPSGGVKANASEIISLRQYCPGIPMLFIGDWYMKTTTQVKSIWMPAANSSSQMATEDSDGKEKDKAEDQEGEDLPDEDDEERELDAGEDDTDAVDPSEWSNWLGSGGLARVAPEGNTNWVDPEKGFGMVADYFVHDRSFSSNKASIINRADNNAYADLYGWHIKGKTISDHAPVIAKFRYRSEKVDESGYSVFKPREVRSSDRERKQRTFFGFDKVERKGRSIHSLPTFFTVTEESLSDLGRMDASPDLLCTTTLINECPLAQANATAPPPGPEKEEQNTEEPVTEQSFKIITWNINHFGIEARGNRPKDKAARKKRNRKADSIIELLKTEQPTLLSIQEVNDANALGEKIQEEAGALGYAFESGPLVNIDKNNPFAKKTQDFREYFPCFYDPEQCSVRRVGVWDGYRQEMVSDPEVLYSATRPAMVYEIELKGGTVMPKGAADVTTTAIPPSQPGSSKQRSVWQLIETAPDHDCFFHSVAHFVKDRDSQENARAVRLEVANYLVGRIMKPQYTLEELGKLMENGYMQVQYVEDVIDSGRMGEWHELFTEASKQGESNFGFSLADHVVRTQFDHTIMKQRVGSEYRTERDTYTIWGDTIFMTEAVARHYKRAVITYQRKRDIKPGDLYEDAGKVLDTVAAAGRNFLGVHAHLASGPPIGLLWMPGHFDIVEGTLPLPVFGI